MAQSGKTITVYGTAWCSDCVRVKLFLDEHQVPYRWVDIEKDMEELAYLQKVAKGLHSTPVIVFPDDSVLVEPSNEQLALKLGIKRK